MIEALQNKLPGSVLLFTALALGITYQISVWIYNIYFHPLAKVPGPKLWAASRVFHELSMGRGRLHKDILALHEKYGDAVRVAPTYVSFIHPDAWNPIMNRKPGQPMLQRDRLRLSDSCRVNGAPEILTADDATHSRHRRMLAHAFSDRALKQDHQPLIQSNVDLLMKQLRRRIDENAGNKKGVDLGNWLNLATFDIIGDLVFGETFNCLEKGDYHPWVKAMSDSVEAVTILSSIKQFPLLDWVTQLFIGGWMNRAIRDHHSLTIDKVNRRLDRKSDRGDFFTQIMKHNGTEREMSRDELMSNSMVLIPAGSETSSAGMASCIYHLLKTPTAYYKLTKEVRSMFQAEKDITFERVANFPYLEACINEALRMYPPVPIFNARVVVNPGGQQILDTYLPDGSTVGIHHWPAYQSTRNFRDPHIFKPSRWLGDPLYTDDRREVLRPFSVGPRNCLGKHLALSEIRVVVTRLLFNFDMELSPESDNWPDQEAYLTWARKPMWIGAWAGEQPFSKCKARQGDVQEKEEHGVW
ncbi:hypothetical protein FQN54_003712 [Arachnomyces sp. PD_36]|nr:hypothetical protein FQN54_003712 [Arachnomyces sp. PD_36]